MAACAAVAEARRGAPGAILIEPGQPLPLSEERQQPFQAVRHVRIAGYRAQILQIAFQLCITSKGNHEHRLRFGGFCLLHLASADVPSTRAMAKADNRVFFTVDTPSQHSG